MTSDGADDHRQPKGEQREQPSAQELNEYERQMDLLAARYRLNPNPPRHRPRSARLGETGAGEETAQTYDKAISRSLFGQHRAYG